MLNYQRVSCVLFEQFMTWSRAPHVWSTKIHDQVSVFQQGIPKYHGWWFSAEFITWLSHFGTHPKSYCWQKKWDIYSKMFVYIYIIYIYIISKMILLLMQKKASLISPRCSKYMPHVIRTLKWFAKLKDSAIWEWFPCPKRQLPGRLRRVVTHNSSRYTRIGYVG